MWKHWIPGAWETRYLHDTHSSISCINMCITIFITLVVCVCACVCVHVCVCVCVRALQKWEAREVGLDWRTTFVLCVLCTVCAWRTNSTWSGCNQGAASEASKTACISSSKDIHSTGSHNPALDSWTTTHYSKKQPNRRVMYYCTFLLWPLD